MASITRRQFVERFANQPLRTEDLAAARALRGLDPGAADVDGSQHLERDELPALFDQLSGGADSIETTRLQRSVAGLGPQQRVTTRAGHQLAALDRLASAPHNPAPGEPGHDPYRPLARMPHGPQQGERLDTDAARSAVRLGDAEIARFAARAGVDPAGIALGFANLRQKFIAADGSASYRYGVALIPRDAVADVALLSETFPAPVPAAHTMLRFTLKPGAEAYVVPQAEGDLAPVERQRNLALSIEAIGPKGWRYDLVDGLSNHFATAYNIETVESRHRHVQTYDPPHPVRQLPLRLSHDEKQRVLREAVDTADRNGMARMYNTLGRNCTNELFDVLDRGIGNQVSLRVHLARAITDETLPTAAELLLKMRGLLDSRRSLPTLDEEMGGG